MICEINVPADGSLAAWSRIWERLEMTIGDTKVSENSGELQQFSIRCSCKRETKNEVATSSSISRARVNPDHVFARSSSGGVNRSQ